MYRLLISAVYLCVLCSCKTVPLGVTSPGAPEPAPPESKPAKPQSPRSDSNKPPTAIPPEATPVGGGSQSPGASGASMPTGAANQVPRPQTSEPGTSRSPGAGNPGAAAGPSRIQTLTDNAKIRLMASTASASYCGDDTSCAVAQRFQESSERLGNAYSLKDWNIRLIAVRDAVLDVEGYVFFRAGEPDVVIAFRGSEVDLSPGSFNDWVNVNGRVIASNFPGNKISGRVHEGFLEGVTGIWEHNTLGLRHLIQEENLLQKNFWVTGHSQGAAIAVLMASRLFEESLKVKGVYAYGMPRMATQDFQTSYNRALGEITLVIANQNDPVPHVPPQFTVVGTNFQIIPPRMQRLGKDGVPPWDIITAATQGNANHHALTDDKQGYFAGL